MSIKLRDSGGVHVYYALPVDGGDTGVFEHISTWPGQAAAHAAISGLEAADQYRATLAASARETVKRWREAAEGFSGDDEYEAASDVVAELEGLLSTLAGECLIPAGNPDEES